MSPQDDALIKLLEKISNSLEKIVTHQQNYTITGASDWPMLLTMFGVIGFLLSVIIVMLSNYNKDNKEHIRALKEDALQFRADCRKRLDKEFETVNSRIERHEEMEHS